MCDIFGFCLAIRIALSLPISLMAGILGIPRRYLCSAKYTEGSSTRYLIREVTSPKTDDELRSAVIELFVADLMGPKEDPRMTKKAGAKIKEMNKVYLTGKLTALSIDEMEKRDMQI